GGDHHQSGERSDPQQQTGGDLRGDDHHQCHSQQGERPAQAQAEQADASAAPPTAVGPGVSGHDSIAPCADAVLVPPEDSPPASVTAAVACGAAWVPTSAPLAAAAIAAPTGPVVAAAAAPTVVGEGVEEPDSAAP